MDNQFRGDESQNRGQAIVQVDEALHQSSDQEVELSQPQQREGVGGEDYEGFLGEAKDCGDGVHREHHVSRANRDDHQQKRGDVEFFVQAGKVAVADEGRGDGDHFAHDTGKSVLSVFFFFGVIRGDSFAYLLDGGEEKEKPKEIEDPAEAFYQGCSQQDEDQAEHQRHGDADGQDFLLQFTRDLEGSDDDDEDKEVV